MRLSATLLASFASIAAAGTLNARYAIKESHYVPFSWTNRGAAPKDHKVDLHIGLKQSNFDELERHLYEVSDPEHARYGDHLSFEEVNELVKPSQTTSDLVHNWLLEHGIETHKLSYSAAKDWIKLTLAVEDIERLLDTEYSVFEHNDGTKLVRTPAWSLPMHLHEHIDTIQPTTSFFRGAPRSSFAKPIKDDEGTILTLSQQELPTIPDENPGSIAKACNFSAVTPTCLRTLYGTIDYKAKATDKNFVGLCDYLGESNNRSDTRLFLQKYRPEAAGAADTFTVEVINGGSNNQDQETPEELAAGTELEGNLDSETILGIAYPTKLTAYTTGGQPPFQPDAHATTNTNEPYQTWLDYVLAQKNVPQVISTSYGDDEQTVPEAYAKRACKGFAQLGARGISLFFASGDSGVGANGTCFTNDGSKKNFFEQSFPPTCPYVTVVGATKNFPEVAAFDPRNGFFSGGGYSNYFPRPSYQDSVVPAYTASLKGKYSSLFNSSGRAYPDISAQGQSYITVWNGTTVRLDGTSASTPAAAAIFALVNDALIAAGKKPLGFLNPWLYSNGYKAFTDVTSGSAAGCNRAGFPAQKGWDAVTGFGTPDFPKILSLLGVS